MFVLVFILSLPTFVLYFQDRWNGNLWAYSLYLVFLHFTMLFLEDVLAATGAAPDLSRAEQGKLLVQLLWQKAWPLFSERSSVLFLVPSTFCYMLKKVRYSKKLDKISVGVSIGVAFLAFAIYFFIAGRGPY